MKKTILLLGLTILSLTASAQKSSFLQKPQVDKRVDLVSIVFRLAGNPEYNYDTVSLYSRRIDEYFAPYRNHKLIKFTRPLRNKYGIAYDSPMSIAVHLDSNLNLPGGEAPESLEERWNPKTAKKFAKLVKKFSRDTKYDDFFEANTDLYAIAIQKFMPVYEQMDLNWFYSFFGSEPGEEFITYIAMANYTHNYAALSEYPKGNRKIYAFLGASVDDTGMPIFPIGKKLPILIHEFCHSFVNPLNEKHSELFRENAEKIFLFQGEQMSSQAYGRWIIMLNEALVRASVIKYMQDHNYPESGIENLFSYEQSRGFLWIRKLVAELHKYDSVRDSFPSLDDYMPQLAQAYAEYAKDVETLPRIRPTVISIDEFNNGDILVNPEIKTITFRFSHPLTGQGYSFFRGMKGENAFPETTNVYYTDDNRTVVMEVILEKGKEYQFIVSGRAFRSKEGVPVQDYEVNFTTRK